MNNWEFFNNKWFLRITSLVLALFLFFYVNNGSNGFLRQNTRQHDQTSALMSNKTAVIQMPLDITTDSNYVVSGYPKTVKVSVSGPSALVTTTSNTQNFKAYIDLTNVGTGEHRVKVKTSGLNSELHATVKPKYVTINIQPRKTIVKKITVRLGSHSLSNNFKIGDPRTDVDHVRVSGSREEVDKVDRVVAFVAMPNKATEDIHRLVTLQAVDKNGQTLNVVIEPNTTNVTIPIQGNNSDAENSSSDSESEQSSSNGSHSSRESSSENSSSSNSTQVSSNNND
ncbi:CdaR family protein [Limosilactobacillus fastidiosus]|uniref:YbbR family protein n=1 Tax=Limosilactobacillus fastidiosus TaxID=2759855 RepID=A0A7W3YCG3_9LACO|nr:CdaR family protein [Limosilactobacillus fastidiosus]MBB1063274.1 hypothetical protein [Limosilactobacillus fastidiosus]MBB1086086.1 hypothetical protein [Limosilactobacillus fastidiosus]MCD7084584.1 hypothetical protein [Limosilactobacillus fastidiosus]MCD7085000.1 hypothetical protein [Limosilactobacillus fastidiosus]MCD7114512.1 hypothetical protein [Limosilactobacillus fastidiosus]